MLKIGSPAGCCCGECVPCSLPHADLQVTLSYLVKDNPADPFETPHLTSRTIALTYAEATDTALVLSAVSGDIPAAKGGRLWASGCIRFEDGATIAGNHGVCPYGNPSGDTWLDWRFELFCDADGGLNEFLAYWMVNTGGDVCAPPDPTCGLYPDGLTRELAEPGAWGVYGSHGHLNLPATDGGGYGWTRTGVASPRFTFGFDSGGAVCDPLYLDFPGTTNGGSFAKTFDSAIVTEPPPP